MKDLCPRLAALVLTAGLAIAGAGPLTVAKAETPAPGLVPPPTSTSSTTVPGRPTTTVPITTTSSTLAPSTTAPPTEPPTTAPPTLPPSTPTTPLASVAPPTAPPTASPAAVSTAPPVTAMQQITPDGSVAAPAGLLPPEIGWANMTCADPVTSVGAAEVRFGNPNANGWFYFSPFPATYVWELRLGSVSVDSGDVEFLAGTSKDQVFDALGPGTYDFRVEDALFPELVDTVAFTVIECGAPAAPLPPFANLSPLCDDADGGAANGFMFANVVNPSGDDGTARTYDWELRLDGSVGEDGTEIVDDGSAAEWGFPGLPAGSYQLVVTDHDEPSLVDTFAADIDPCVGSGNPSAPMLPPVIVGVGSWCSTGTDGYASVHVVDPNFPQLGDPASSELAWTLMLGPDEIAAGTSDVINPKSLTPGDYDVTVWFQSDPSLSDQVTFTILDCQNAPVDPPPTAPTVTFHWARCDAIGGVGRVLFTIWNPVANTGEPREYDWTLQQDQQAFASGSKAVYGLQAGTVGYTGPLPDGPYDLVVVDVAEPDLIATQSFAVDIQPCPPPPPPADMPDDSLPTDPVDPSATQPATPDDQGDDDPTATAATQDSVAAVLPATGSATHAIVLLGVVAAALGVVVVRAAQRRAAP